MRVTSRVTSWRGHVIQQPCNNFIHCHRWERHQTQPQTAEATPQTGQIELSLLLLTGWLPWDHSESWCMRLQPYS
eukprot:3437710-Amphidinium_carterae.1